jgi:hypothetical protein
MLTLSIWAAFSLDMKMTLSSLRGEEPAPALLELSRQLFRSGIERSCKHWPSCFALHTDEHSFPRVTSSGDALRSCRACYAGTLS